MPTAPARITELAQRPGAKRFLRYSMVSVVAVVVSQVALFVALHFLSSGWATITSVAVGTVPSYELNRRWAWGKSGKSHLWKEIMPFWIMTFIGLAFSLVCVSIADGLWVEGKPDSLGEKAIVQTASLGAFGILWVAKFVIINKVLFAHRTDIDPVLDGRAGVPT